MSADLLLACLWLTLTGLVVLANGDLIAPLTLHGKLRHQLARQPTTPRRSLLDLLFELTVPKQWFWHFYLLAIGVAGALLEDTRGASVPEVLFTVHVVRRLIEQLTLFRHKTGRMHFLAYILGMVFYPLYGFSLYVSRDSQSVDGTCKIAVGIWLVCQVVQCVSHVELARLKKPSVPTGLVFRRMWCPHYAAEIGIYAAMALVVPGKCMAVAIAAVFVAASLSLNAENQRLWYSRTFGVDKIGGFPSLLQRFSLR